MRLMTVPAIRYAHALGACGLLTLATSTVAAAPQSAVLHARAEIRGEGITGTADFREVSSESAGATDPRFPTGTIALEIAIKVKGLTPGPHGVHIHEVGACEPTFAAAGGHFDPGPHGMSDPDANHPFHMGDLPNLIANALGEASFTARTNRLTLSAGPLSIFDADGSAIVVHGNPDQGVTGEPKSGLSGGPRVACGVITKVQ
jgi:superoxide dismutase, Cu-Zn family